MAQLDQTAFDEAFELVKNYIDRNCDILEERLKTLEMHALKFRGVWAEGAYQPGDSVSFGGSLWTCSLHTRMKPAPDCGDWVLTVRRGRDGKDGTK